MDNAEHTQRLTFCFSYPAHNRVSHTSNERIVQHCWKNIQLEYSKCSNGLKRINQISSFFFSFFVKAIQSEHDVGDVFVPNLETKTKIKQLYYIAGDTAEKYWLDG